MIPVSYAITPKKKKKRMTKKISIRAWPLRKDEPHRRPEWGLEARG
jgi:hypothetical protein